ncbi:MAG: hypothetical protein U1F87_03045 [Kiritimatiellia bacterium]
MKTRVLMTFLSVLAAREGLRAAEAAASPPPPRSSATTCATSTMPPPGARTPRRTGPTRSRTSTSRRASRCPWADSSGCASRTGTTSPSPPPTTTASSSAGCGCTAI